LPERRGYANTPLPERGLESHAGGVFARWRVVGRVGGALARPTARVGERSVDRKGNHGIMVSAPRGSRRV